jgi:hypothetical protein
LLVDPLCNPGPTAACLTSSTVNGSSAGYSFTCVKSALVVADVIYLSSAPIGSDAVSSYGARRNSTSMEFYLPQLAPGSYPAGTQNQVYFHAWGDQCQELIVGLHAATGGTITITQTSPTVTGSFDLTFASGHVTGSFNAIRCAPSNADGPASCI